MPELPEIETLKLQLSELIAGSEISRIEILKKKSFPDDPKLILGARIDKIERIAKMLVFHLSNGLSLVSHLKMSGQYIYRGEKIKRKLNIVDPRLKELPNSHTRVVFHFSNGDKLFFNDMRIFGWIRLMRKLEAGSWKLDDKKVLRHLGSGRKRSETDSCEVEESGLTLSKIISSYGPDPLTITDKQFIRILKSSSKSIKIVLMDQGKLAGVGNIYANESLFLSGIHPEISSNKITSKKSSALFHNLKKVLADGLKWGGASANNFRDAFGEMGSVQEHFLVYGQKGKKCPNDCGEKIRWIKLGGRGTFFCPKCQRF